ncbi:hypothetical protein VP1G_11329 [Cytospora mali]|uniref:Uncharacterized protein n=1 Tax=Cytospora mali TaxID=578113 RepID=A0A194VC56_CYTMA|nr:hypothetical protein VP1G_11329 [Valsa mali var. pyri (nom. inval.)]
MGSVQSRRLRRDERSDATNAVTDIGEDNPCEGLGRKRGNDKLYVTKGVVYIQDYADRTRGQLAIQIRVSDYINDW